MHAIWLRPGDAGRCGKKEDGPEKVLKVGYFPNLTHAQALVGLSDGTFQKALGDEIKIKEYTFNAGPSEIEALLAGEIDIGYIGPVPAINGFVKSRGELSIIAGASDAGAVLVARPGAKASGILTVKGLPSRSWAIPRIFPSGTCWTGRTCRIVPKGGLLILFRWRTRIF